MFVEKKVNYIKKNGEEKRYKYLYRKSYYCKTDRRKVFLNNDDENEIIYSYLSKNIAKYIIAKCYRISPARVRKIINEYIDKNPEDVEDEPFFYQKPEISNRLIKSINFNYRHYGFSKKKLIYLYNLSRYTIDKLLSFG